MTVKKSDGDYVIYADGEETVDYYDEVFQSIGIILGANKDKFYPNKNFGSSLTAFNNISDNAALSLARSALSETDGVRVMNVTFTDTAAEFEVKVNDTVRKVIIKLEKDL